MNNLILMTVHWIYLVVFFSTNSWNMFMEIALIFWLISNRHEHSCFDSENIKQTFRQKNVVSSWIPNFWLEMLLVCTFHWSESQTRESEKDFFWLKKRTVELSQWKFHDGHTNWIIWAWILFYFSFVRRFKWHNSIREVERWVCLRVAHSQFARCLYKR